MSTVEQHYVAKKQHRIGIWLDELIAAADPLDEVAMAFAVALDFFD